MSEQAALPEGYKKNAKGNLVPIENIKPIDSLRDEVVLKMVEKSRLIQQDMLKFKNEMMEQLESFLELSASEYEVKWGGTKGNVTLVSFDGTRKVRLSVSERISLDERLEVAKELIHYCINDCE